MPLPAASTAHIPVANALPPPPPPAAFTLEQYMLETFASELGHLADMKSVGYGQAYQEMLAVRIVNQVAEDCRVSMAISEITTIPFRGQQIPISRNVLVESCGLVWTTFQGHRTLHTKATELQRHLSTLPGAPDLFDANWTQPEGDPVWTVTTVHCYMMLHAMLDQHILPTVDELGRGFTIDPGVAATPGVVPAADTPEMGRARMDAVTCTHSRLMRTLNKAAEAVGLEWPRNRRQ